MDVLKGEFFKLVLRNREIETLRAAQNNDDIEDLEKEYVNNKRHMDLIIEMAGPVILQIWREEWLSKMRQH